jgi:hypothetical protein
MPKTIACWNKYKSKAGPSRMKLIFNSMNQDSMMKCLLSDEQAYIEKWI